MLIEIRCGNFSNFDASLGRYVECDEKLLVTHDQLGDIVTCPKCSQPVEVPFDAAEAQASAPANVAPAPANVSPKADRSKSDSSKPSGKARSTSSPKQKSQRKPVGTNGTSKQRERPRKGDTRPGAQDRKTGSQQNSRTKRTTPGGTSPLKSNDVMSMDFGGTAVESKLDADRKERCRKCGNISIDGKCTVCRFVEPKFEKLYQPLDEVEIELVGFQRWFCRTMSEGVSMKLVAWASHIMLGMLGALLLVAAGICIAGFGPGVVFGVLMLLFILGSALLYISFVLKGHQFLRDPNARLAWFQRPFWNMVLTLARMQKWENYDSRLKNRRIIKVRESLFRDREISGLEGLKTCQVLDLEGTDVTDRGLLNLYDLKHLHCVILKKTKVTHQGVFRLQQSFPRLWVWY